MEILHFFIKLILQMSDFKKWINILLAIGTTFILLLTAGEILTVVASLILSILHFVDLNKNVFLKEDVSLKVSTILIISSSFFLIIVFILQLRFPFKHFVHFLRHFGNFFLTGAAIYFLYSTTVKKQNKSIQHFTSSWNNSQQFFKDFETANNCNGIFGPSNCSVYLNQTIISFYSSGRKFKSCFGIFWGIVLFYAVVSLLVIKLVPSTSKTD